MKIYNKIVYNWNNRLGRYILIEERSSEQNVSSAQCKGASGQQQNILNSQQAFMKTLQQDFGTAFAGQQNILNSLTSSLSSILQGGPGQYGFTAPETAALNTQAMTGTAAQTRNAQQAAGEAAASVAGGNAVLPTNAAAQTQAGIAQAGAQQTANQLLGIKTSGYETGRQNFWNSVSSLGSVASMENPTAYAGAANTAGSDAASNAAQIQQMNNAASPWNTIGGILGGLAGGALNMVAPGSGSAFGAATSALKGAQNSNTSWLTPSGDDTSGLSMIPYQSTSPFNV